MGLINKVKSMATPPADMQAYIDQSLAQAAQGSGSMATLAAQQQAVMAQAQAHQAAAAGTLPPQPGNMDPIAGVDLTLYARIVKSIAPHGHDQSLLPGIAASQGIPEAAWTVAHNGWNSRIQSDPAVGRAFSDVYRSI